MTPRLPARRRGRARLLRCAIALCALPALALATQADTEQQQCQVAAGTLLVGRVVSGSSYRPGP
jgi:hypothetical protein